MRRTHAAEAQTAAPRRLLAALAARGGARRRRRAVRAAPRGGRFHAAGPADVPDRDHRGVRRGEPVRLVEPGLPRVPAARVRLPHLVRRRLPAGAGHRGELGGLERRDHLDLPRARGHDLARRGPAHRARRGVHLRPDPRDAGAGLQSPPRRREERHGAGRPHGGDRHPPAQGGPARHGRAHPPRARVGGRRPRRPRRRREPAVRRLRTVPHRGGAERVGSGWWRTTRIRTRSAAARRSTCSSSSSSATRTRWSPRTGPGPSTPSRATRPRTRRPSTTRRGRPPSPRRPRPARAGVQLLEQPPERRRPPAARSLGPPRRALGHRQGEARRGGDGRPRRPRHLTALAGAARLALGGPRGRAVQVRPPARQADPGGRRLRRSRRGRRARGRGGPPALLPPRGLHGAPGGPGGGADDRPLVPRRRDRPPARGPGRGRLRRRPVLPRGLRCGHPQPGRRRRPRLHPRRLHHRADRRRE